ncbi:hypothetical protein LTEGF4_12550 [Limnohabitans sp. TEGF004]|nr:hypothetical protein LTEGF4_12550 [Limnohabitans sp. TEGF004]
MHITPQHHLAPIAVVGGTGVNGAVGTQGHGGGLAHRAAALPVAAHQHGAASGGAFGFDQGAGV